MHPLDSPRRRFESSYELSIGVALVIQRTRAEEDCCQSVITARASNVPLFLLGLYATCQRLMGSYFPLIIAMTLEALTPGPVICPKSAPKIQSKDLGSFTR
ncbi:uncharacterized protein ARMOST_22182 [Armillaria ostoyae]|uniref:Uncharacterized protein n=1 Tax=Armillaria ostoyae TaxID=47428 RepID=A0A284SC58_ARMOS|nr:uncharacterized protein ARMOST_22182 [Armillaria ostoyae]